MYSSRFPKPDDILIFICVFVHLQNVTTIGQIVFVKTVAYGHTEGVELSSFDTRFRWTVSFTLLPSLLRVSLVRRKATTASPFGCDGEESLDANMGIEPILDRLCYWAIATHRIAQAKPYYEWKLIKHVIEPHHWNTNSWFYECSVLPKDYFSTKTCPTLSQNLNCNLIQDTESDTLTWNNAASYF